VSPNRLLGADFLRAVACMMVLLHHLVFRLDLNKAPEGARPVLDFLVMGSFGVAVFFVLSGFLLARPFWQALDRGAPMPDLAVFALRRAARILPGFWLALSTSLVLSVAVSGSVLDGQLIGRFLAGFFLVSDWHWVTLFPVDNNGPLWSIGFEITSYVLLPLCLAALFALGSRGWPARLVWLAIIALVLAVHMAVVQWAPIDEAGRGWDHGLVGGAKAWVPRFNPIGFFAIFAIGALAAGVQIQLAHWRHWVFDLIGLAAIASAAAVMAVHVGGLTEGFGWLGIPYGFPTTPLLVGTALVALPSSVLAGRLLDNPVARYIAEISFGIYIWHFLIIALLARLVPPAFDNSGADAWTLWLWSSGATVLISLVVATVSFYVLERPVVRWARSLERRRDGQALAV